MTYEGKILELTSEQVFVFGSNVRGFHGGGAAGLASFGHGHWRSVGYDKWPNGTKGKWNVKGCGSGFQEGTEGKSYAIPTVTFPGARRSIPLHTIHTSILGLYAFATTHPELTFLVAYAANSKNLNGYTDQEMATAFFDDNIPHNIIFEKGFFGLIKPPEDGNSMKYLVKNKED